MTTNGASLFICEANRPRPSCPAAKLPNVAFGEKIRPTFSLSDSDTLAICVLSLNNLFASAILFCTWLGSLLATGGTGAFFSATCCLTRSAYAGSTFSTELSNSPATAAV